MGFVCISLLLIVAASTLVVRGEFVFMLPNHNGFAEEHLGVSLDDLLRRAIEVYNYSDLIVSVPDDWEYLKMVQNYIHQRSAHSKRSDGGEDELWQQVHLHQSRRQRWLHDTNFVDDVMTYVSELGVSTTNSWGLDRIDQQRLTAQHPLDGQYLGFDESVSNQRTVHFYVIDTGVATHPAIPQTISYDFSYYPNDPADCNGHGTHVAGIAMSVGMGVCPGARHVIHSIKVLDCFGMGNTTGVLAGLSWVKANFQSPAVINLSIGIKGISSSLSTMIKSMHALGISIAGAVGNQGDNACLYFPAGITLPGGVPVVGVGALQMSAGLTDTAASFSNWGACVRVYAPGDRIQSTLPGGLVGKKSGTSMASPAFAGAVILALATTPTLTALEAQTLVLERVTAGTVTGANVVAGTNNCARFYYDHGPINHAVRHHDCRTHDKYTRGYRRLNGSHEHRTRGKHEHHKCQHCIIRKRHKHRTCHYRSDLGFAHYQHKSKHCDIRKHHKYHARHYRSNLGCTHYQHNSKHYSTGKHHKYRAHHCHSNLGCTHHQHKSQYCSTRKHHKYHYRSNFGCTHYQHKSRRVYIHVHEGYLSARGFNNEHHRSCHHLCNLGVPHNQCTGNFYRIHIHEVDEHACGNLLR